MSQEQLNTENINEILDEPTLQTQQINETDITDLTPDVETGNNSKIYYFKTFVAPHINFKSSNETLQTNRHSNKTTQSDEVSNQDYDLTSEDRLVFSPGKSSSSSRKSFIKVEHHNQQFIPRSLNGNQERIYSEYKTRSGYVDENNNSLEDLLNKELVPESSTINDNKQVSFSQSGNENPQLSILHNYPEIIIDHITYDNDKNDKNKMVKIKPNVTEDSPPKRNVVKEEPNKNQQKPRPIRYNIPEEEFEIANHEPPEYLDPRNYLTPEMKGLIVAIIQKKAMHDALLKQTTENESRKQSMLIGKILQRLHEKRLMSNNVKSSYSFRHERITPAEMKTLSYLPTSLETSRRSGGNHLKKSYFNAPFVPSKWEIHNRLLRTLVQMYKPEILKRTLLVAGLIDRIVPSIDYRTMY